MLSASLGIQRYSNFHPGNPWPLGSSITSRGVNFSIAAPNAKRIELLLFRASNSTSAYQTIELRENNRSGDYWHIEIEGIGEGTLYAYRVLINDESGDNNISPKKILLDPCARAISGWDVYQRELSIGFSSNIGNCLKGIVCERNEFDFISHPRPKHPWHKTIIYELHIGSFTQNRDSGVNSEKRGTFEGLIEKLPYLKDLGITTIELLPVSLFDPYDAPNGMENQWGYSPLNWFTPHKGYVYGTDPLKARDQFRNLVANCHDNGLEVILDIVYNHTTEGAQKGPVISWRGFDDNLYYQKDKKGNYLDVSGCGNTIAANRPLVRKLILESMKCWANELGIDGFRFDLGIALSRGEQLKPLDNPPLFEEIESDPILSGLKLISEPWDCGGLYRLDNFPAKQISTWNGHFRDDLRRFWKGDKDTTWPIKDRLKGSPELYKNDEKSPQLSINFITSHDGYTLNDLVSFNNKFNLANGEKNNDGDNHNNNWNHGIEGPSSEKSIQDLRNRQKRNLLTTLFISPGIPMLLMGDEFGRSQGGNNNTWCQNSQLGWMIWDEEICDVNLHYFVKKLIRIRRKLPELFSPSIPYKEIDSSRENHSDKFKIEWHGVKKSQPDWSSWSHTISYSLNKSSLGAVMWVGFNAYSKAMTFDLPKPYKSPWKLIINTASVEQHDLANQPISLTSDSLTLMDRSTVLLLSTDYSKQING